MLYCPTNKKTHGHPPAHGPNLNPGYTNQGPPPYPPHWTMASRWAHPFPIHALLHPNGPCFSWAIAISLKPPHNILPSNGSIHWKALAPLSPRISITTASPRIPFKEANFGLSLALCLFMLIVLIIVFILPIKSITRPIYLEALPIHMRWRWPDGSWMEISLQAVGSQSNFLFPSPFFSGLLTTRNCFQR